MKLTENQFKQCLRVLNESGFTRKHVHGVVYCGEHKVHGDVRITCDTSGHHISEPQLHLLAKLEQLAPMHRNAKYATMPARK